MDYKDKEKLQLVDEKVALQSTITTLTDEIECLSIKNEEFLSSLKKKDFYNEYQRVLEELRNLKDAHAILINMIKDDELQVQTYSNNKNSKTKDTEDLIRDTSFIVGTDLSKVYERGK